MQPSSLADYNCLAACIVPNFVDLLPSNGVFYSVLPLDLSLNGS